MQWDVKQAAVIVESFIAVGVSILRFGFGVFLSQPSPHELPHLPLHFVEHLCAVGSIKVFDPSFHHAINAGDTLIGFPPQVALGGLLTGCPLRAAPPWHSAKRSDRFQLSLQFYLARSEKRAGFDRLASCGAGCVGFFTPLLCIYLPAQNDLFQKPFSG